jgi:hypothetical protein
MTDLFVWGGPVTPKQPNAVQWLRPTQVLTVSREGSSANYTAYQQFAAGGPGWPAMASKAGIAPEHLGSLGIGGFSAFHGFANAMLKNPADLERTTYVHLADACFMPAGSTSYKDGFMNFALEAARGRKLLVATSNGPWGEDIHYCYTYPDERGRTCYSLTSGSKCIENLWNAVRSRTGVAVTTPKYPPGVAPPSRAFQMGNFLWFHYDPTGNPEPHGFHVHKLATPYIQYFGAPWMAKRTYPGMPEESSTEDKILFAVGGAAVAGGLVWAFRRWKARRR